MVFSEKNSSKDLHAPLENLDQTLSPGTYSRRYFWRKKTLRGVTLNYSRRLARGYREPQNKLCLINSWKKTSRKAIFNYQTLLWLVHSFLLEKKNRSLWPCQDYWYLNEETVKDAYPLPLISKLLGKLSGATIFSKLNLRNGHNKVHIKYRD